MRNYLNGCGIGGGARDGKRPGKVYIPDDRQESSAQEGLQALI